MLNVCSSAGHMCTADALLGTASSKERYMCRPVCTRSSSLTSQLRDSSLASPPVSPAMTARTIVWFRRDLRLADNPALFEAVRAGVVIPVFIWSPEEEGQFQPGRASRWWLKHSLLHLDASLRALGTPLILRKSHHSLTALLHVARAARATHLFYNHLYDPVSLVRDHRVRQGLTNAGIVVYSFSGDLLYEPWEIFDEHGQAFTRFDDYWEQCRSMPLDPDVPLLPPKRIKGTSRNIHSCSVEDLGLENGCEASSNALLVREWLPGWDNADKALDAFLKGPLLDYARTRSKVDTCTTSLLSPHLHYGELSVRKVLYRVRLTTHLLDGRGEKQHSSLLSTSIHAFLRQLGYRDYSRYLIFNFPFTHDTSLLPNLRSFPWCWDEELFKAWKQGRTGYPLVDAGMRQLWATGWLHNSLRLAVATFCVKFLHLPWRWGLRYFWDTLLDADLECDILGWQLVSGSLPDAHPLHRMDHPMSQGQELDPHGEYVRRWLPELSRLPAPWVHHPWEAPAHVLAAAGVELGVTYPKPIVDMAVAVKRHSDAITTMWQNQAAAPQQPADDSATACLGFPQLHRFSIEVSLLAPAAAPPRHLLPDSPEKLKPAPAAPAARHATFTQRPPSVSSSTSHHDDESLLHKPTESQQQAAATLLNVPVEEVLVVADMEKLTNIRKSRCCCF